MFLGIRDIVYAKGRFALIGGVVGLITLLLVMLTGLTGGLGLQNTSALRALDVDRFAFGTTSDDAPEVSFANSTVTQDQVDRWAGTSGVTEALPLGFAQAQLEARHSEGVSVIGVPEGAGLVARAAGQATQGESEPGAGGVVLSESVAEQTGASLGGTATISGTELTVTGVVPDEYYSHAPAVWVDDAAWARIAHAPEGAVGTVVALRGNLSGEAWEDAARATGTEAATTRESFAGLASYSSEQGSLLSMQGFLYGISALVTVSFLTVWTIQRTRDIAVLRALGAGARYLMRDAVGQAAVVLGAGALLGAAVGLGLGALARQAVLFQLAWPTILGPAAGIWALGLLGSLLAVRRVAKVDPLIALGGN